MIGLLGVPAAARQLGLGAVLGATQAKLDAAVTTEAAAVADSARHLLAAHTDP